MIKKLVDIVFFSSIFISFGAAAIVYRTSLILNKNPEWNLVVFIFFSTLFIYNLTKIIPIWNIKINSNGRYHDRHFWNLKNKSVLILITVISLLISSYLALKLSITQQTFLVHLGLISGLYAIPIFTGKPLRALPLLKVFLIAYVWSATSILPVLEFSNRALSIVLENFFFILAITIPFDIRDYEIDRTEGVITIPYKLGIKQSKRIAIFCLIISSCFTYSIMGETATLFLSIGLNLLFIPLILISNERRGEYFYLGVIDGLLILRLIAFI